MEELRAQCEESQKKRQEAERENNRLKRSINKLNAIENDKKKLERLILDVNTEKKDQVELLLAVTHDFYIENVRLKHLLEGVEVKQ